MESRRTGLKELVPGSEVLRTSCIFLIRGEVEGKGGGGGGGLEGGGGREKVLDENARCRALRTLQTPGEAGISRGKQYGFR